MNAVCMDMDGYQDGSCDTFCVWCCCCCCSDGDAVKAVLAHTALEVSARPSLGLTPFRWSPRLGEPGLEVIAPQPGAASSRKMHSRPLLKTIRSSEQIRLLIRIRLSQQHKQDIFGLTSYSNHFLYTRCKKPRKKEEVGASKL